jgi:hypothetical protein
LVSEEKIAKSESLSALFSFFKDWSQKDSSLRFKESSVINMLPEKSYLLIEGEVNADTPR